MRYSRRSFRAQASAIVCILFAIVNIGCEDPSSVGLGVIGEGGGDPLRVDLPSSHRPADISPPVTSNVRTSLGFSTGPATVLTGVVTDPLFGTVSTKGYIDVALTSTQSATYRSGTITSVRLTLTPSYVYGDTMAATSLIISEMPAEWPSTSMSADTTLTAGSEIMRVDYAYQDTTLVIDFPSEWFSARSATLLSADILNAFHGFELATSDPSAVVGFSATSAGLAITTTTGTANLVISKIFTHVERGDDVNVPEGRAIIQDGVGQNLALGFPFGVDSLRGVAVSRAVIELRIDKESMDNVPEHFVRPTPPQFDFVAIRPDGTGRLLRSAVAADSLIRFVSTTAAPGEFTIVRAVQQAVAGSSEFEEYHVRISEAQAAINAILVYASEGDEQSPKAVLTVTKHSF